MEEKTKPPAKKLHPWQEEAADRITGQPACILSAPTGGGKTTVSYLWAGLLKRNWQPVTPHHRVFFTAPIKALSNERYMDFRRMGMDVGIETGDIKKNTHARVICCTQEIYTLKYARLPQQRTVIDEFHFILQDDQRSRAYIDGIKQTNPNSDILFMSATFGNLTTIQRYIERISARKLVPYQTDIKITETLYVTKPIRYQQLHDAIVFIFSRRGIDSAARAIAYDRQPLARGKLRRLSEISDILGTKPEFQALLEKGVAIYHGGLLPKEKMLIENAFREGILDVVVGTDALALGVNLPAQTVAFGQLAKRSGPIGKNEFMQMAGRAGRKGYFDTGYVGILQDAPSFETKYYRTTDIFKALISAPPEPPTINLAPKIKDLFLRKTTVTQEAKYIAEHSLPEADPKVIRSRIQRTLKDVFSNMTVHTEEPAANAYEALVVATWSDELTVRANIAIAELFFTYGSTSVKSIADIIAQDEPTYLQALLKTRKYLRQIPEGLQVDSRHLTEGMIRAIDETVFEFEEKISQIQKGAIDSR